jgi:hypothetical protein
MRGKLIAGWSVLLMLLLAAMARAQYESPREFSPLETRYVSVGAMPRDFAPRAGYSGGDALAIRYNVWMPVIGFHQKSMDALFGYTRYTLNGSTRSAAFLGATLSNELPLVHSFSAALILPVILSLDYTKSEGSGLEKDQFNMASIGVGSGLKVRFTTPGTEFTAHALSAYHFSFEGLNTGNGSSVVVLGEATFVVRTLDIVDGIVLGYRFRHQTWNAAGGRLNYHVTTHGPYIGVLL